MVFTPLPTQRCFEVPDETAWPPVAEQLTGLGADCPVWTLEGDLGAGKTTLVRVLCNLWAVSDAVSSPSFGIINEYEDGEGQPIHHIDLYRVKNEAELIDLGLPEMLDSGERCLIEWPALASPWLSAPYLALEILHLPNGGRQLTATRYAPIG